MYSIALTGGVASGKSEATRRFEALGIVVVDADVAAREVVEPGSAALAEITAHFGDSALLADGSLDRRAMRERIFADPQARQRLESIVHPRIRDRLQEQAQAATGPYVIVAVPLLVESFEHYRWADRVLVVDVAREVQIARLTARDGITLELAREMLAAQASREQRLAIADDVIDNSSTLEHLDSAVQALHQDYLRLAANKR